MRYGTHLTFVFPHELTKSDLSHLLSAAKAGYPYIDAEEFIKASQFKGAYQFWRVDDGIIVTEIIVYPTFKELNIALLEGKNLMSKAEEIMEDLISFAKEEGCRKLTGFVQRKGLKKFYSNKLGMKPTVTKYEKEID